MDYYRNVLIPFVFFAFSASACNCGTAVHAGVDAADPILLDASSDGGTVTDDGGTVTDDGGTVTNDGGTVTNDGGTVTDDSGTVTADGAVVIIDASTATDAASGTDATTGTDAATEQDAADPNTPPTVSLGDDISMWPDEHPAIVAVVSDPDQDDSSLSCAWAVDSLPAGVSLDENGCSAQINVDLAQFVCGAADFNLTLTATDDAGAMGDDTILVQIRDARGPYVDNTSGYSQCCGTSERPCDNMPDALNNLASAIAEGANYADPVQIIVATTGENYVLPDSLVLDQGIGIACAYDAGSWVLTAPVARTPIRYSGASGIVVSSDAVQIENCDIRGSGVTTQNFAQRQAILLHDADNVVIRDNVIYGNGEQMPGSEAVYGLLVESDAAQVVNIINNTIFAGAANEQSVGLRVGGLQGGQAGGLPMIQGNDIQAGPAPRVEGVRLRVSTQSLGARAQLLDNDISGGAGGADSDNYSLGLLVMSGDPLIRGGTIMGSTYLNYSLNLDVGLLCAGDSQAEIENAEIYAADVDNADIARAYGLVLAASASLDGLYVAGVHGARAVGLLVDSSFWGASPSALRVTAQNSFFTGGSSFDLDANDNSDAAAAGIWLREQADLTISDSQVKSGNSGNYDSTQYAFGIYAASQTTVHATGVQFTAADALHQSIAIRALEGSGEMQLSDCDASAGDVSEPSGWVGSGALMRETSANLTLDGGTYTAGFSHNLANQYGNFSVALRDQSENAVVRNAKFVLGEGAYHSVGVQFLFGQLSMDGSTISALLSQTQFVTGLMLQGGALEIRNSDIDMSSENSATGIDAFYSNAALVSATQIHLSAARGIHGIDGTGSPLELHAVDMNLQPQDGAQFCFGVFVNSGSLEATDNHVVCGSFTTDTTDKADHRIFAKGLSSSHADFIRISGGTWQTGDVVQTAGDRADTRSLAIGISSLESGAIQISDATLIAGEARNLGGAVDANSFAYSAAVFQPDSWGIPAVPLSISDSTLSAASASGGSELSYLGSYGIYLPNGGDALELRRNNISVQGDGPKSSGLSVQGSCPFCRIDSNRIQVEASASDAQARGMYFWGQQAWSDDDDSQRAYITNNAFIAVGGGSSEGLFIGGNAGEDFRFLHNVIDVRKAENSSRAIKLALPYYASAQTYRPGVFSANILLYPAAGIGIEEDCRKLDSGGLSLAQPQHATNNNYWGDGATLVRMRSANNAGTSCNTVNVDLLWVLNSSFVANNVYISGDADSLNFNQDPQLDLSYHLPANSGLRGEARDTFSHYWNVSVLGELNDFNGELRPQPDDATAPDIGADEVN